MSLHPKPEAFSNGHLGSLTPADALFPVSAQHPLTLYPAGSEIYAPGERAGSLYQVGFGCVRVYRLLADGRRQISAFHVSGETFGFDTDGAHHFFADAVCSTGVRTIRVDRSDSNQILPLALKTLVRAHQHLLVLGRQNAIERVAAFLLDLAERQGELDQVDLPMSRTDIGDYLGLTIETVSRVLSRLKQRGVIRLPGLRSVEITDWRALQAMSE
jgi:CRP/FNR family nitrogen fixation transcriptional regulator